MSSFVDNFMIVEFIVVVNNLYTNYSVMPETLSDNSYEMGDPFVTLPNLLVCLVINNMRPLNNRFYYGSRNLQIAFFD